MIVAPYFDLLGKPFVRGGRGPDSFDCYGLVKEMYRRAGIEVPDFTSPGTLEEVEILVERHSRRWTKVAPRTVGSVITFRVTGHGAHVGLMLENDRFLHAVEGSGVCVERLTSEAYKPLGFYIYE